MTWPTGTLRNKGCFSTVEANNKGRGASNTRNKLIHDSERITTRINLRECTWGQNQEHMLGQLWGRGGGHSSLECGEGSTTRMGVGGCEVGEK